MAWWPWWCSLAIRPRFGPGPKTALITGLIFWCTGLLFGANFVNMGIFPLNLTLISLAFNLTEFPTAVLFGANVYRED